jgi:hypothetical protein
MRLLESKEILTTQMQSMTEEEGGNALSGMSARANVLLNGFDLHWSLQGLNVYPTGITNNNHY